MAKGPGIYATSHETATFAIQEIHCRGGPQQRPAATARSAESGDGDIYSARSSVGTISSSPAATCDIFPLSLRRVGFFLNCTPGAYTFSTFRKFLSLAAEVRLSWDPWLHHRCNACCIVRHAALETCCVMNAALYIGQQAGHFMQPGSSHSSSIHVAPFRDLAPYRALQPLARILPDPMS